MKRSVRNVLLSCAALSICLLLAGCSGEGAQTIVLGDGLKADGISVSATGEVSVTPDTATVSVGVFTQKASARQAQQENARTMSAVMAAVTRAGIRQEDIKTAQYSVYPSYGYKESRVVNYDVYNVIQFETGDVNKVGEVLDAAADAGANTSFSVAFGLKDEEKAYRQALELAVKDAGSKAGKIAAAAGRGVGTPRSVTETRSSSGVVRETYTAAADKAGGEIPVLAGTLKVQATVEVIYDWR